ncbi:primary-amine oxidase [Dictyobacter arantiisoli]|uniref:Amine oxidase n=1 Tax=Dictyobacter arantiisoli TaxID=2014874 RepID=A0A5A5T5Y7_9CHLR|nr:primary-amine oxidase [Dictyobacter arantiisoli]GCF06778.1 amine oxidase [Dictyobacter arantiisoli]
MTDLHQALPVLATAQVAAHPLDQLSGAEVALAVQIIRQQRQLDQRVRFVSVNLHEPAKEVVLQFTAGSPIAREALIVLLDNLDGATYEAIVSLSEGHVSSWKHIPDVQPPFLLDEFFECEQAVKTDANYQEALRKRGITDLDLLMVDPWSAGYYGDKDEKRRLAQALTWVRSTPGDNGYAHPVQGLIAFVDLNTMEVVSIVDNEIVPLPPAPGNYTPEAVGPLRTSIKTIDIQQPDGPSFSVDGYAVQWEKWHLRIGFTTREGLVLHTVNYEDQGKLRPIIYRAALGEMVVPYGDPGSEHNRKNAFDIGEYGLGMLTNSLELGCDCLGHIHYFDANMTNSHGNLFTIKNAVCMHEEDHGILWKHVDWRTNQTEVRRSRRLVISFIATVGNYEYGYFWYLYQDGTIEFEIKLTGIMNTGALPPGVKSKYGQLIAPQLYAPIHQHIFNVRLDMMVDGLNNSVYEVNTVSEPGGPANPHGNAYYAEATLLEHELAAQRTIEPHSARYWKITNPESRNALGDPVAYKLMPGSNTFPFVQPDSYVAQRAGFIQKHLWVTPYQPEERFPAGEYPNQHKGGAGLPSWTQADRSVENTDIVVWYTMNIHHIPSPEDWPVMPAHYINFMLKPVGFFDHNPALDIPPSEPKQGHCCAHTA